MPTYNLSTRVARHCSLLFSLLPAFNLPLA